MAESESDSEFKYNTDNEINNANHETSDSETQDNDDSIYQVALPGEDETQIIDNESVEVS